MKLLNKPNKLLKVYKKKQFFQQIFLELELEEKKE